MPCSFPVLKMALYEWERQCCLFARFLLFLTRHAPSYYCSCVLWVRQWVLHVLLFPCTEQLEGAWHRSPWWCLRWEEFVRPPAAAAAQRRHTAMALHRMLPTSASQMWYFALYASVSVWRSSASAGLNHSFFCAVCGISRSTASMMEFGFFFPLHYLSFLSHQIFHYPPQIWKSILLRFTDRDGYFWPEMTAGKVTRYSSRLMRTPFFSTFKNGQRFCFPSVADKQSSASAGRSAVCWPLSHLSLPPVLLTPLPRILG